MKRVITVWSITGAIAATLFVSVGIAAAAAAAVWAISGLLNLNAPAAIVLAILVAAPSLWAIVKISNLAFRSETDPENN